MPSARQARGIGDPLYSLPSYPRDPTGAVARLRVWESGRTRAINPANLCITLYKSPNLPARRQCVCT